MLTSTIGIDIAKAHFDVAFMRGQQVEDEERFSNDEMGFGAFEAWLPARGGQTAQVVMEATGIYGDALAAWLYDHGYAVSVVNPFQIKAYGQAQLRRAKTDPADARLIADFGRTQALIPWTPPPPAIGELRSMVRYGRRLQGMIQAERQRLATSSSAWVRAQIQDHLTYLQTTGETLNVQMREHVQAHPQLAEAVALLTTIPGIGTLSACRLVAAIDIDRFDSPKQVVAFLGLNPTIHQSGQRAKTATPISKMGNADLRQALYMPALVAKQHNPLVRGFYERLVDRGKPKQVALVAAMRKLVHIIFGVWTSGQPFDPDYEARLALVAR
jgi:transposase